MPRELLILRHGKSDWNVSTDDYHRPLKKRGQRGAERIGAWLAEQQLIPDYVISSTATRAINTAALCSKAMGLSNSDIQREEILYLANIRTLLNTIQASPAKSKRVMIVGHNPGLEDLVLYLADRKIKIPNDGKLIPTATVAHFQLDVDWSKLSKGLAKLKQIQRASLLPPNFPSPTLDSKKKRKRPAYYYQQSSAIPYRVTADGLEIMIITSSGRKHWGIPKGVIEPELSPQESAAKEAYEEAGVEGIIDKQFIGSYQYEKWGASCKVSVYPLAVKRVIQQDEWKENHRERRWVSVDEAMVYVKQNALVPILKKLKKSFSD